MKDLKPDISSFKGLQAIQRQFSDLFFSSDLLTADEKEEMTRSFALALHSEISSLVGEISFKDHINSGRIVNTKKILYESVDAFRYILAILNLWGHSSDDFLSAFENRNSFLHTRFELDKRKWDGLPVVIVDVDEVICSFRKGFTEWLIDEKGIDVDINSKEYYHVIPVKGSGFSPEGLFEEFIDSGHLRDLEIISETIDALNQLKMMGFWIHLLTARPDKNLQCLYDTYYWLERSGLNFDRVSFSPEKMIWLTKTEYFESGSVVCAIDDSVKHAMEYAKHGIKVVSPKMSYNMELQNQENVTIYKTPQGLLDIIMQLSGMR